MIFEKGCFKLHDFVKPFPSGNDGSLLKQFRLSKVLNIDAGLRFWVGSGTLLGVKRQGCLFDFDSDVDWRFRQTADASNSNAELGLVTPDNGEIFTIGTTTDTRMFLFSADTFFPFFRINQNDGTGRLIANSNQMTITSDSENVLDFSYNSETSASSSQAGFYASTAGTLGNRLARIFINNASSITEVRYPHETETGSNEGQLLSDHTRSCLILSEAGQGTDTEIKASGTSTINGNLNVTGAVSFGTFQQGNFSLNSFDTPSLLSTETFTLLDEDGSALDSNKMYRFRIATLGTNAETGAVYLVYYDQPNTQWISHLTSRRGVATNEGEIFVDTDGLVKLRQNNSSRGYILRVFREIWDNNIDDIDPSFFGSDYFFSLDDRLISNSLGLDVELSSLSVNTNTLFSDRGFSVSKSDRNGTNDTKSQDYMSGTAKPSEWIQKIISWLKK